MRRKMNKLIGLLKKGDRTMLSQKANIASSTLSKVLNGQIDITVYPVLASAIREYINKREQELVAEEEINNQLDALYKKIDVVPPTDEELLLKGLTSIRIDRMTRPELLVVVAGKAISIKKAELAEMDLQELAEEIKDQLGFEARRNPGLFG